MEYVIDFQGFRDDGNNFIFKELCIQCIQDNKFSGASDQYLFLPPFNYKHLSEKKKTLINGLKTSVLDLAGSAVFKLSLIHI